MKIKDDYKKRIISFIDQYAPMNKEEMIIFEYGMDMVVETAMKLILIVLLGIVVGLGSETGVALFSFCTLRFFAGVIHCKTNFGCITDVYLIWLLLSPDKNEFTTLKIEDITPIAV